MSERSGVINIALEGKILITAFSAAVAAYCFQSPWLGALTAMGMGIVISLFYGLFVLTLETNQIIAGTAINLLAAGIPPLISKSMFAQTGSTPSLAMESRFVLAPMVVLAISILILTVFTRWSIAGTWHYLAGEHPKALAATGVSPKRIQWFSLAGCGIFCGLSGASLSLFLSSGFTRNMSAGRGFIALAALILGKWAPLPTMAACLLFGATEALQIRVQAVPEFGSIVPSQLVQALPYLVTLLILTGFVGRSKAPKALGLQTSKDD